MPRTLYLHIGSHKTGTTSIQKSLSANILALAALGVDYPIGNNDTNLHDCFRPDKEFGFPERGFRLHRPKRLLRRLDACKNPTVVLSSEGLSYVFEPESAAEIHAMFQAHFDRTFVVSYLRRQDLLAVSHHQEGSKRPSRPAARLYGNRPNALPQSGPHLDRYLNYDARMALWADAFGRDAMRIRAFERDRLVGGDVVADFLTVLGIDPEAIENQPIANASFGFTRTKVGHLIKDIIKDEDLQRLILQKMTGGGKMVPSRAEAQDFLAPYLDSNRRLNEIYKITEAPDLFSSDFSDLPEVPGDLWTEDTATAMFKVMAGLLAERSPDDDDPRMVALAKAAQTLKASDPVGAAQLSNLTTTLRPGRAKASVASLRRREAKATPDAPKDAEENDIFDDDEAEF